MVPARDAITFHPLDDVVLARAWDELADELSAPPFARHRWFEIWSRAYDVPVQVATYGSAALEGLVPIVPRGRSYVAPVNEETPGFQFLATSPEARLGLMSGVLAQGPVHFRRIGESDLSALEIAAGRRSMERAVMQRSPFIEIASDWDTYAASLRQKFRKDLKRRERRLEEAGAVEIGWEELPNDPLGEVSRIESLQWKADRGTAMGSRPQTKAFYEDIARWASDSGWLRLWFLKLDGKAIAFALDAVVADVYYGLKVGYDPSFAKTSPGMLLQDDTVRYAFEQGLDRFEFLGDDEAYKLNWTDRCHELFAVRVYRPGPLGTITRAGGRMGRKLKRSIAARRG